MYELNHTDLDRWITGNYGEDQYTGNSTGGFDADDPPERRTDAEIQELKDAWELGGGYDLEDTDGFEAHYQELREWREAQEAAWAAHEAKQLAARAAQHGFTPQQMTFIERLGARIRAPEDRANAD